MSPCDLLKASRYRVHVLTGKGGFAGTFARVLIYSNGELEREVER